MDFYIVIPAHNEEAYLARTLQSLIEQTLLPKGVIVVDDHSTDSTPLLISKFCDQHSIIRTVSVSSKMSHEPGSKVINAFYKGLDHLDDNYDIICKFDADLEFPPDYLEKIASVFEKNMKTGMAGGFCYIERSSEWVLENLTNKDHIRGALKAYRKECFQDIGGLKKSMGWDTVDELLAQYHGWEIETDTSLHVKHLKPTGTNYSTSSGLKQGQAFKKMRYGFLITLIASTKLAVKKGSRSFFVDCLRGFFSVNNDYLVTPEEGKFIRRLRWKNIIKKLF